MAKTTVRLPFGEGVERSVGSMILRPGSFNDLRNIHLREGRVVARNGLELKNSIGSGVTDIIAVHPLRGAQQSLLVCYNATSREVTLRRVAIDPVTLNLTITSVPGVLWTMAQTASFPIVSVTDSFGKAFIAHEESNYALRQPTKVYDPSNDTFTNLLYNQTGGTEMRFRGVRRWLSYLVGWGFGTTNVGPPDDRSRPEIVRLSLPGDPEFMRPEFYFIAGQRGEPVIGCAPTRNGLVVAKENELHLITGTSRIDFDIDVIDPNFGTVSANAMIEVGGGVFFWSAEGPRYTTGGASESLGTSLDLRGEVPDEVIEASDLRAIHAAFRPDRDEIEWIFPAPGRNQSWSYVLDIRRGVGEPRWHHRRYEHLIRCNGLLAGNIAFNPSDPATAPFISGTSLSRNSGRWYTHTVSWSNNNVANLPGGSVVEIWGSAGDAAFSVCPNAAWALIATTTASGTSQSNNSVAIAAADTCQNWRNVALRYRLPDGTYYGHSSSTNPMDWPAATRATLQVLGRNEITTTALTITNQPTGTCSVQWSNGNHTQVEPGTTVEIWTMGADAQNGTPQDAWTLQREVALGAASQTETGLTIGRFWKHVALRYKIGGKYYTHSQSSNPLDWPAASRAAASMQVTRPLVTFAWGGTTQNPSSPGTITSTIPLAADTPSGTWQLEVYALTYAADVDPATLPGAAWQLLDTINVSGTVGPGTGSVTVNVPWTYNFPQNRVLAAARLRYNGSPRTLYESGVPLDWPPASRTVIPMF